MFLIPLLFLGDLNDCSHSIKEKDLSVQHTGLVDSRSHVLKQHQNARAQSYLNNASELQPAASHHENPHLPARGLSVNDLQLDLKIPNRRNARPFVVDGRMSNKDCSAYSSHYGIGTLDDLAFGLANNQIPLSQAKINAEFADELYTLPSLSDLVNLPNRLSRISQRTKLSAIPAKQSLRTAIDIPSSISNSNVEYSRPFQQQPLNKDTHSKLLSKGIIAAESSPAIFRDQSDSNNSVKVGSVGS